MDRTGWFSRACKYNVGKFRRVGCLGPISTRCIQLVHWRGQRQGHILDSTAGLALFRASSICSLERKILPPSFFTFRRGIRCSQRKNIYTSMQRFSCEASQSGRTFEVVADVFFVSTHCGSMGGSCSVGWCCAPRDCSHWLLIVGKKYQCFFVYLSTISSRGWKWNIFLCIESCGIVCMISRCGRLFRVFEIFHGFFVSCVVAVHNYN